MVKLTSGLGLEKIFSDISLASPEFFDFMNANYKPYDLGKFLATKTADGAQNEQNVWADYEQANVTTTVPKIHLWLDTQICKQHGVTIGERTDVNLEHELAIESRNWNFTHSSPHVSLDLLTITREELKNGGLVKTYPNGLPVELYRGENSLLSRCNPLPMWARREIGTFYDIATQRFEELVKSLFTFQDEHNDESNAGIIASWFMNEQGMSFPKNDKSRVDLNQAYHGMFSGLINKRRKNNEYNYIADKILCLANFGVNFFSYNDRSIVLTADKDFNAIEHFIYQKVLPAYIAKKSSQGMEERAPGRWLNLGITANGLAKLEDWAGKQIKTGLEQCSDNQRMLTNLIYNCATGETYSGYVHPKIKEFILDSTVNLAKSYVAERSILGRLPVETVFNELEKSTSAYNAWLNDLHSGK